jgi:hypothetical protein
MDGIIAIVILLVIVNLLGKGLKAATQSGQQNRRGQPSSPQRTASGRPPLTPVARPGSTGAPDWSEIMMMLNGQQAQKTQSQPVEGSAAGSMTGPSMMEGTPGMMDGSQPMMDESGPDYEGQTLPGEASADAVAVLPKSEASISPPMQNAFRPKKYDSAAMRDAVVWAEILAKPKALRLRRVAR